MDAGHSSHVSALKRPPGSGRGGLISAKLRRLCLKLRKFFEPQCPILRGDLTEAFPVPIMSRLLSAMIKYDAVARYLA